MKYTEHYEVLSHDVDMNDNLRPSFYCRFFQETADHQMRDRKPSYAELYASGAVLIITRMQVEIFKPVHKYDEIAVSTWKLEDQRATFRRCYSMERDGEICALGYSEWAGVSLADRSLLGTDEIDLSNFETDEMVKLDLPKRFRWPKDLEFQSELPHHVTYQDIDINSHMNNTNYLDMLWSRIPDVENLEVTSMNIRYMKEGLLGSNLSVFRGEPDAGFTKDPRAQKAQGFYTTVDSGEKNIEVLFGLRDVENPNGRIIRRVEK